MVTPEPQLDAAAVNALLQRAFPEAPADQLPQVLAITAGRVQVRRAYAPGMLRPGGVIAGPNLMALADIAAYALILAHVGDRLMAVTSSLTMNFLRGAAPGDLNADAELLRLGRRIAVCEVRLWSESAERLAAQATVTYALPST